MLAGLAVAMGVYATLGSAVEEDDGVAEGRAGMVSAGFEAAAGLAVVVLVGVATLLCRCMDCCGCADAPLCCCGLLLPLPPGVGAGCSSSRHSFIRVSSTRNCLFEAVR